MDEKFLNWYKTIKENIKTNNMNNQQIAYMGWLEGKAAGIEWTNKILKKNG